MRRVLAALGSAVWLAGTAGAASPVDEGFVAAALDAGEPRVLARLLVHPDDTAARGPVRVAVELEIAAGWHVYDPLPGELGLPTRVSLHAEGARFAPIAWPAPHEVLEEGLATRIHSGTLWLASEARFDDPVAHAGVVQAEIELVACRDRCIPARFSLSRSLDVGAGPDAARLRARFATAAPGAGTRVDGEGGASHPPRVSGLLAAVVMGLLGGLVLNAMPCVLPVLAIKLAWLASVARLERRTMVRHALAYAGGSLAAMGALAGATLLLRAGGASVGWGFQLQEPRFVLALALVTALFAANLLGAYEIGAPPGALALVGARTTGARRSLLDGCLTVALATPCTAPFLGAAVGFALAGSALEVLAVFASIGIGLAAPVLVVAVAPGAVRVLPRGGAWMLELRRVGGLALLATVVWLLFILGRVARPEAVSAALVLLWLAALGAYGIGWQQRAVGRRRFAGAAIAGAALLAAALGLSRFEAAASSDDLQALAFDPAEVSAQVSSGRAAFVYFTADWCVTCKLNERVVLGDERVRAALRDLDVAVFRADWTRRDEAIRAELARFGRAGVPAYLVYAANDVSGPSVLPELLSVDLLLGALRAAAGS
jgi:thiol:disulfide interchange protein DsbD